MRDEHVAVGEVGAVLARRHHADGAAGETGRGAKAAHEHLAVGDRLRRRGAAVTGRGDRPRLQEPQSAARIERPLGVLRSVVVALDPPPELGDRADLVIGQHRARGLHVVERALHGAAVLVRIDRELFAAHLARDDRQQRLVDDVAVGRHAPRDDRLAEPEGAFDHQMVGIAGGGVDREHHAGPRRRHLTLHDHRDVHVCLTEAALGAIEDGARAEQRRPAATHGCDDLVRPADVEEGLVHAREGRGRGVLARRRRAHGDRDRLPTGELREGGADSRLQPGWHRLALDHRARVDGRRLQGRGIVDVDAGEPLGEPCAQASVVAELGVRGRPDHEPGRHREAGLRQLTEVRALAAGERDVVARELVEAVDKRGRRSGRRRGLDGHGLTLRAPAQRSIRSDCRTRCVVSTRGPRRLEGS